MPNETRTYRRSELYEQIWAEPVREVAKRYGVSDVALAKTCRKLAVPLPGVGYWARRRAGRRTHRTALPPLPQGLTEEITVQVWTEDEVPLSPEVQVALAALGQPEAAIVVPEVLADPHELVARAQKLLRRMKPYEGIVHCWREQCLDIAVTPESLDRALRVIDALIKAMEARGLQVAITDPPEVDKQGCRIWRRSRVPDNATRVRIGNEWVQFGIFEGEPGILDLRILDKDYHVKRASWKDGKRLRVEQRLNEFIAAVYVKAEASREFNEAVERNRLASEAAERRRQEERTRAEAEAQRAAEFKDKIARWRLAQDIRAFSQEAHDMLAGADCSIRRGGWVDNLLTWGMAYADRIDPLTPLAKEIAGHIARREVASTPLQSSDSQPQDPSGSI